MSIEELESISRYSIEEIPKSSLREIRDIQIDTDLPGSLRLAEYLKQIQNPYCFLCDGIPVEISFVNEEQELSEILVNYFCSLKR